MKDFFRKTGLFLLGVIVCLLLYLMAIRVYVNISKDPIIFMASVVMAVAIPCLVWFAGWKFWKRYFDINHVFFMYVSAVMATVLVSVFGPVFIDRSISYHIAFYAAEQGEVDIEDIRDEFSVEIFNKRIHDAQAVGVIEMREDNTFVPTVKAKILWWFLGGMGKWSGTMDTYENMKAKVKQSRGGVHG